MARLHVALDALAEVDVDAVPADVAAEMTIGLCSVEARLVAQRARFLHRADAAGVWSDLGYRSAWSWLAHRGRMTARRARAEVRFARVLRRMSASAAALASGTIGLDAARCIAGAHRPAVAAALERDEAMLVDQARTLDVVELERVVRYWEQHADPDGLEAAATERHADRRVRCSSGLDGIFIDGWLPTVPGTVFRNELERLEDELFLADWKQARAEHGDGVTVDRLARSGPQRRADALVEMAARSATAPADGRRPRPLVSVLVGYETFAGRVCELAAGQVVTPGEVAALLDEAAIERVVFDGPSRVLDIGHARLFTGALRRAIQLRDRWCIEPGCHVPGDSCEIDHLQPAAYLGETTQSNGVLRCPFHHRRRHRELPRPPPA